MEGQSNYSTKSDADLIACLRDSDQLAFTEILSRYSTLLINFAYKRVSDLPLAQDLVHDVFVYLWVKRQSLFLKRGLQSFIFTALRNRILDHFKKQKVSQKYIDHFYKFLSKEENNTDFLVRQKDLSALIEREINALPVKLRTVFKMVRNTDMSRKEIAELLTMPENTVKTNMQRALRILRSKLDGASYYLIFIHL